MDITITPDTYTPSVDGAGNYIDNIPIIKNGLFCPCGSRKDKTYENTTKFAIHIKSKSHQKWLQILNQNRANYYVEMLKYKELVENQQKIITQLENHLQKKTLTIDYLTEQLTSKTSQQVFSIDLLDIN
jgi:ABC-type phosphate transport system auxiliary subunit